ncbi:MAG: SCO6745 family protein, partial [Acidimicrobiia bacterium]
MDPREVIQATAGKIGDIGAAFYFAPETLQRGKDAGLDGFRFYFLGRGGVLGDVEAGVIRAAFGYFEPGLVEKIWSSAKEIMAPRDAARLYISCAHDLGRAKFANVEGLDAFVEAATTVIAAVEGTSLPLFEAVRCEPVPDDAPAAAMHQAMVLRELRGSVHLLANTACGLESRHAHGIKRPDAFKMFGYEAEIVVTD